MPILKLSTGAKPAKQPAIAKIKERIRRARLISFNPATWIAVVRLDGSMSNTDLPVGQWNTADSMTTNAYYAVLLLDDTNPNDGVIVGPYGGIGALTGAREKLTANRTYYVATTGSDSNNGLTAGAPFLTVQKAIDVISDTLDLGIYNVTIQLAAGTYSSSAGNTCKQCVGAGQIIIVGDETTPANVVITTTGAAARCFYGEAVTTVYHVRGVRISSTGTGTTYGFFSTMGSVIKFQKIEFNTGLTIHIAADQNGNIEATGNYSILSGAGRHSYAANGGIARLQNITITLTGSPNFTTAFADSITTGVSLLPGNTYVGAATGKRYDATVNGVIYTNGASSTYLPGNVGGTTATGGQYA